MKHYTNNDVSYVISKFHKMVEQGPFYICTCCDQLWYNHSVLHANKLSQILKLRDIFVIKQILTTLSGCVKHVMVT